jgi:ferritin-like metal-binding protein YciE
MSLLTPNEIKTFRSLYCRQLRYLLSTENQSIQGLKIMMEHATDVQLKQAFQSHLQESEVHRTRLEDVLATMNHGDTDDKKDPIIAKLVESGSAIVKSSEPGALRDAGLIATAQEMEHYEIASYGTAREWAKLLDRSDDAAVLQRTLDEEKHADELLSTISERANSTAAAA